MFNQLLTHLNCRPEHGLTVSSILVLFGWITDNKEIITLLLQWTSFIIAIAVGCLTLYAKLRDLQIKVKTKRKYKTRNNYKDESN